jgi:hypothetical protein
MGIDYIFKDIRVVQKEFKLSIADRWFNEFLNHGILFKIKSIIYFDF